MQLSVYVFYELLIRLQELEPDIGEYSSYQKMGTMISLRTTTGTMVIPDELIAMQLNTPALITAVDLSALLKSFRPGIR